MNIMLIIISALFISDAFFFCSDIYEIASSHWLNKGKNGWQQNNLDLHIVN
ncbi:MAG: hypothetical protein JWQ98_1276 [Chlorobi bacterium]|nr:hypothetical protein [Chlorobiota bacterium]